MVGFDEGDGRNNALFKHRSQLAGVKGWQTMLRFINNFYICYASNRGRVPGNIEGYGYTSRER